MFCWHQGQGHSGGSYKQNMIISTVSWELWIVFAAKLCLMVYHLKLVHNLSHGSEKRLFCCHQGQGHSGCSYNQNMIISTTIDYILRASNSFFRQTLFGGASSLAGLSCEKTGLLRSSILTVWQKQWLTVSRHSGDKPHWLFVYVPFGTTGMVVLIFYSQNMCMFFVLFLFV